MVSEINVKNIIFNSNMSAKEKKPSIPFKEYLDTLTVKCDSEFDDFVYILRSEYNENFCRTDSQSKSKISNVTRKEANSNIHFYTVVYKCILATKCKYWSMTN